MNQRENYSIKNMQDLFHGILKFLYKFPLDGKEHDLRKYLSNKINNSHRPDFLRLQQVIFFLVEKNYLKFEQKNITGKNVKIKYGEEPPKGTDEANFETTYPMASLTLEGHHYLYERNKQKWQFRLYNLTVIIAIVSLTIAFLSFYNNSEKKKLQEQINIKDKLIDSLERKR